MDPLIWTSKLSRSIFLAAITLCLWLYVLAEIFAFFLFKTCIIANSLSLIILVISVVIIAQIFTYLYKTKNRYEFIISQEYMPFSLSVKKGILISYLTFLFGLVACVGMGLIIDNLLQK
jgi:hypothetical protein